MFIIIIIIFETVIRNFFKRDKRYKEKEGEGEASEIY